ncbi:hypothetical protein ABH15_05320 [Methanoculleus taiwanensis]|uniref:Uncharacterized protein n=1 Tax=Methanoculleus taiwanensis TaxID=1550565 RepID=A0A498GZ39_9EURY|nr:hypothetical protein [Methanoculleus taiwanensis]RXE55663.1 hypothetical protein ABH15_05320 [Methanoculleus taiwanensis]
MSWQDIGITVITILFSVMLLPQLRDVVSRGIVLNFFSALFTAILSTLMCLIFATLELWLSVVGQSLVAAVWMALAYFSVKNVRDTVYPERTLWFVAGDFFAVWAMGVIFLASKGVRRIFSRNQPD